ncbi:hypothetical protein EUX98_g3103 [Antrodiella citrinella]|uniref:F-box domain-containing protein n=1 Tax=Antrodiella citrinella TaxID=2447956 RepID=A0A4S4N072_9APHY|nr:hypothetical protein EUX98_g3103 [Antrodiella citrinella]
MSTDGSQESASLMHVTTQFEIAPEGGLEEDTNVFLDKIIYNPLIQETLFLYLDPVEFLRLARTCHLVHAIVDSFVKRTFNINRSLSRYFTDPVAFRSLQAHTGTLMSGSFALQFFDRSFYPESDLDLYVPQDFDRELMLWLLSQGYKFIPTERQSANLEEAIAQSKEPNLDDPDWNDYDAIRVARTIQAVYTFKKSISADVDDERKVQCIVANKTPMEVILSFHSSECSDLFPTYFVPADRYM